MVIIFNYLARSALSLARMLAYAVVQNVHFNITKTIRCIILVCENYTVYFLLRSSSLFQEILDTTSWKFSRAETHGTRKSRNGKVAAYESLSS